MSLKRRDQLAEFPGGMADSVNSRQSSSFFKEKRFSKYLAAVPVTLQKQIPELDVIFF